MSENAKDVKRHFRRQNVSWYEEFVVDSSDYYPMEELNELNVVLQARSRRIAIVTGSTGIGKTTLVNEFVKQDLDRVLGTNSIKIFKVKRWSLVHKKIDIDSISDMIAGIIEQSNSKSIIIYSRIGNTDELKTIVENLSEYADELKEFYNLKFLKFILEVSSNNQKDSDIVKDVAQSSVSAIYVQSAREFKELLSKVTIMVEKLSQEYKVKCSKDILIFFLIIFDSFLSERSNLTTIFELFEYAFTISKNKMDHNLKKDIAKEMFKKSFEFLESTPTKATYNTAIHEAGHTVARLVLDEFSDIEYVTVIPLKKFNGLTAAMPCERVSSLYRNEQHYLNKISCSLAGRVAENVENKEVLINSGASSDLKNAMKIVESMLFEYGFSKSLGANVVLSDNYKVMSENMKNQIEDEKKKILEKAENIARDIVFDNIDFVEELAKRLQSELVVSGEDVYKMWNKK